MSLFARPQTVRRQCIDLIRNTSTSSPRLVRGLRIFIRPLDQIDIKEFQQETFSKGLPALFQRQQGLSPSTPIVPAEIKWFEKDQSGHNVLNLQHLREYESTHVQYEVMLDASEIKKVESGSYAADSRLIEMLRDPTDSVSSSQQTFHRFEAPLALFLNSSSTSQASTGCSSPGLYIAQTQLGTLPSQLRADLPTPKLVLETGRGDLYDSSLWLGYHPTYTPLHRDPNPNVFLQISGAKVVRLFEPTVGAGVLREARRRIGSSEMSSSLRGAEMMEGPERAALDELVWAEERGEGVEVEVRAGDALFIPKGWWHSIKSLDTGDIVASVNWWFR